MDYILTFALAIFVLPGLFLLLSRRAEGGGGIEHRPGDHGISVAFPSSDQPTPGESTVNQITRAVERQLPPG